MGLTMVQVAGEDLQDKRPHQSALSQETTSRATQWVLLYLNGFSGNFSRVVSPT